MTDQAIAQLAPGSAPGRRAGGGRRAGQLVPAAPGQPATSPAAASAAARPGPATGAGPGRRAAILAALHSERFADAAPAQVWATLLDEGTYLGSLSTFYRLLRAAGETRERRAQATHPAAVKPELLAVRAESGLVVGHHQAARPGEMDLLLPLRDPGHLLPVCRRLDGRHR